MRSCGDCRLCCKVFPLPLFNKPAGAWCCHAGAKGCAIHGPLLPEVCRRYDCFWREHATLPDSWRPDRIGVVVTEAGSVTIGDHLLQVVILQVDSERIVSEQTYKRSVSSLASDLVTRFEAGQGFPDRELIGHLIRQGFAVMMIHGLEAKIEFDRTRWPGISADDIEAALRYELSQDAEELKRLGAVENEYRALSRDEAEAACREDRQA
jgi:hypothetical protein